MAELGRLVMKPNRTCSIAAMALCFMLAACNRPTESASNPPSADSFHVELFEVRVGEAIENVNGAAVTAHSSGRRTFCRSSAGSFSTRNIRPQAHA